MSYTESSIVQNHPREIGTAIDESLCRSGIDPIGAHRLLADCLQVVGHELSSHQEPADIVRTQQTLDRVADMVVADATVAANQDYEHFLRRLTRIYANGCDQRENTAFATTAAGYAAVVEAVSRKYPELDYTNSLGQLLEFMTRLFSARDASWTIVYKHLRAIPDSVEAKQTLNRVCAADIREWYDAGVHNLFSLHDDLKAGIRALAARADQLERKIQAEEGTLAKMNHRVDPKGTGKIVALAGSVKEREIATLKAKRDQMLDEIDGREGTLGLIESDIQEFEGVLRDARRAYYLRVV